MEFYDVCAKIIDANQGNEAVDKVINEIKQCQMMFNCSVFTKELRRYITGIREGNPYNDMITKYKKEKEPNHYVMNLEEHKAKDLRKLLPWEQKKLYMKAVLVSLQLHQDLTDKDIKHLVKAMVYEDAKVFHNYKTGGDKLLTAPTINEEQPTSQAENKPKKRFKFFK